MQYCSNEALDTLFLNLSTSVFLLLIFLYCSFLFLSTFFRFIAGHPLLQRLQDEFGDYTLYSDEEEDEDEEEEQEEGGDQSCYSYHVASTRPDDSLIADIINGGQPLVFTCEDHRNECNEELLGEYTSEDIEEQDNSSMDVQFSAMSSPCVESEDDKGSSCVEEEDTNYGRTEAAHNTGQIFAHDSKSISHDEQKDVSENTKTRETGKRIAVESEFPKDGNFLVLERKKFLAGEEKEAEIFNDSCTTASTSKSSSEWRSSIKTEDPFSSSSRRSCPKWESYTVFQRYDEEMMFLGKVSAQKLHETESLKSIQAHPRSMSERIVRKLTTVSKRSDSRVHPYKELESAYVAQICLTWEALNWNYNNFQRKKESWWKEFNDDIGCPAIVAQQFQRFQVLLLRYVENEPYEHGRRPEVYARIRKFVPKLLLVPEYHDFEDDKKDEGFRSRIPSAEFLLILEECIRTFMSFLEADREKPSEKLKSFFLKNKRSSVDPSIIQLTKKVNGKKKKKLKDLRRSGKCNMRKKKMKGEEEMKILFSLIDLKLVSRVLRMSELKEEHMHWCEEKMTKVRISEGKLQRDHSPVFFPAHQ